MNMTKCVPFKGKLIGQFLGWHYVHRHVLTDWKTVHEFLTPNYARQHTVNTVFQQKSDHLASQQIIYSLGADIHVVSGSFLGEASSSLVAVAGNGIPLIFNSSLRPLFSDSIEAIFSCSC